MTYSFAPVYCADRATTMTSDPFELTVYVLLLNGLWIVVPALLILQSSRAVARAMSHGRAG